MTQDENAHDKQYTFVNLRISLKPFYLYIDFSFEGKFDKFMVLQLLVLKFFNYTVYMQRISVCIVVITIKCGDRALEMGAIAENDFYSQGRQWKLLSNK